MIGIDDSQESRLLGSSLLLLTTLNNGLEDLLGRAAKGVIFNAGLVEGHFIGKNIPRTKYLQKAIETINDTFRGVWSVDLFKAKDQEKYFYQDSQGLPSFNIIIRECPIRQAVLTYNLEQGGPLCYLTNGYFCGIIGEIMNQKTGMEILHNGPNACLKRIYFRGKRGA